MNGMLNEMKRHLTDFSRQTRRVPDITFFCCCCWGDSSFQFFSVLDVYDDVEYLSSLGKAQTAAVKRDATVGVAQANRDAGIRVSDLTWSINIQLFPQLVPPVKFIQNLKRLKWVVNFFKNYLIILFIYYLFIYFHYYY